MKPTYLQTQNYSPLASVQTLNPSHNDGSSRKKSAGLIITSLVDAFSILVIYLLFGTSLSGESIPSQWGVKLPPSLFGQLLENDVTLRVKNNKYFINEQPIEKTQIAEKLTQLLHNGKQGEQPLDANLNPALVIVADQNGPVEDLNPILLAASEAGYSQLKMAVQYEGE